MIQRTVAIAASAVLALIFGFVLVPAAPAKAGLVAQVDLSAQRMRVFVDGKKKYTWRVSTGKPGYKTKLGTFTPYNMVPFFYSKKWKMKLPHTVWVNGSTAIHGTYLTSHLGHVASHGCIRLSPAHAAKFYALVKQNGLWFTTIHVVK